MYLQDPYPGKLDPDGLSPWMQILAGKPSKFKQINMMGPIYDQNNVEIVGGGGGGGGGSQPSQLIWKPGVVSTESNFFNGTASALNTHIAGNDQIVELFIDDQIQAPVLDADVNLHNRVRLVGRGNINNQGATHSTVEFSGGSFVNPVSVKDINILDQVSTQGIFLSMIADNQTNSITFQNCVLHQQHDTILIETNSLPAQSELIVNFNDCSIQKSYTPVNRSWLTLGTFVDTILNFNNCKIDFAQTDKLISGNFNGTKCDIYNGPTFSSFPTSTQIDYLGASMNHYLSSSSQLIKSTDNNNFITSFVNSEFGPSIKDFLNKFENNFLPSNITGIQDTEILSWSTAQSRFIPAPMPTSGGILIKNFVQLGLSGTQTIIYNPSGMLGVNGLNVEAQQGSNITVNSTNDGILVTSLPLVSKFLNLRMTVTINGSFTGVVSVGIDNSSGPNSDSALLTPSTGVPVTSTICFIIDGSTGGYPFELKPSWFVLSGASNLSISACMFSAIEI